MRAVRQTALYALSLVAGANTRATDLLPTSDTISANFVRVGNGIVPNPKPRPPCLH